MRLNPRPGAIADGPAIHWLGQAGFWIDTGAHRLLIDPYLSDSLARKYAGKRFDHRRMMPVPVTPEALPRPDIVLITHAHTDHMDPDTLGPLHRRFPDLPFVVPAARVEAARERIGENASLIAVNADEEPEPLPGLTLRVLPAAHEMFERDEKGQHVFLGYAFASGGARIAHSGDTIPYTGLAERFRDFGTDILLLPVNGRDAERRDAGIPGNLTLDEAITVTTAAAARYLVPHHFGMFAFNTLDPATIDAAAAASRDPIILRPEIGMAMDLQKD
ncbi:MBL fold metallo-hydrolase [uncultured Paracoccus sp.]|uniref:MBL fold metallo-hydrolase n=1 Tax=uncultured Paracoccus sp. TaxID=189685 RepID=UPI00259882AE|nr:MBL fold metallo-hydrolase [uncultured Paracoccus sp.]